MAQVKRREEIRSEYALFAIVMRHLWTLTHQELVYLARISSVSETTLYNWRNGYVTTPRLDTLTRVSKNIGYKITFQQIKSKKPKLERVK